jgi:TRAP-type C4-dicarboxylate transport system permease small subunit
VRSRRRALVAVVEVLAVIVLAWLTWWCWHRGVIVMMRNGVALNRIEGRWWAAATGAATLAGILLLDAGRQLTPKASPQHAR